MTFLYYLAAWLLVALITGAGLCRVFHKAKLELPYDADT